MLIKRVIISLLLMSAFTCASQADLTEIKKTVDINEIQKGTNSDYFNLANIVDNLLNNDEKTETKAVDNDKIRQEFITITSKFNQGNANSAYDDYSQLIDKLDQDILLLNLSKVLYKIGFFSLAQKAEEKIVYKNQYYDNINDLELCYLPKSKMQRDDEIFFAKAYASIFFDNSAHEANNELMLVKEKYQKNDYYNYLVAQSYFEQKDYHKALASINKAISINGDNVNYKLAKADILAANDKYSEALNIIKKLEKNSKIIDLSDDILIKKQILTAQAIKNEKEKKYIITYKTFLEGNYEKTKKDCLSILNFDKNNDKIISLYAKAELAQGNVEKANTYFTNAYKIDKNNINTIIGLGDIYYINKDYKNAIKMYKKALDINKRNVEVLNKLSLSQKEYVKNPKELKRTNNKLDKMPKNYQSYYNCAISVAQKNSVLKEDFLKKSLNINPMYKNALGETVALDLKNKNFKSAKGLIDSASFTLEKNYYYYYLLGLYNQAKGKRQEAIRFYKTSLDLNSNFEEASVKLLKLIPNKDEEI